MNTPVVPFRRRRALHFLERLRRAKDHGPRRMLVDGPPRYRADGEGNDEATDVAWMTVTGFLWWGTDAPPGATGDEQRRPFSSDQGSRRRNR